MTEDPNSTRARRLEYLRGEIRAERISWGELAELQSLALYIDPDDVELLEWAGVPESARETLERIAQLRVEIEDSYRHGWTPEHQLCELASLQEIFENADDETED